jgi:ATP-binding cassette, subfamily B, bacterial CvaB/MchF/RaxB
MVATFEPEIDEVVAGARGEPAAFAADESRPRLHFGRGRRLPMVRQSEAAECGLACLAMIAGYYGQHMEMPAMRRRFSLSLKGVTLTRLIEIAQSMGLACRPLRIELNELRHVQTPCILHWNLNHFVVLREVHKRGAVIHDPAIGERTLTSEELGKHVTGIAVEVSKGPEFRRKRPDPPVSLRTLAGSIQGLGRGLLTIFSLALALELFGLLAPQFLQMVVDQVLADGDHDLLTFLGLSFLLLMVVQTGISALRTWTVLWLGTHFNLNWTGNVFQHLLRLPQSYFLKRHLGDVVSRFGAISVIQHTLTTRFVEVVLDGLMAMLTLAVLLLYSPLLTALIVTAVVLYGALRMLYYRVFREANLGQITVQAKQQTSFMEAVRGVQTLRLFNQVPARSARYLNATADTLNAGVAVQRLGLVFSGIQGLVSGGQRIAVLWLGAWLALKGQFSAGMLMAFAAYADQFGSRASSLVDYIVEIRLLRIQSDRLADIVLTPPEAHVEGIYAGPLPEPSIRFENVSFRYAEGEEWILKGCTFEVASCESVAIVGPSGCGKSTLARLLLGLLDPQEGRITIGGIDLKHLGKNRYRSMIGSVMQDDHLFAGSIADNIAFFDEAATPEVIEVAARQAELHTDIIAMPMGYHSLVGDMGSSLSGGQQQRLSLARALYRSPKILVLDEATSHLDIERERRIAKTLGQLHMTRIVIAHRTETIASAERVLVMQKSKVSALSGGLYASTEQGKEATSMR